MKKYLISAYLILSTGVGTIFAQQAPIDIEAYYRSTEFFNNLVEHHPDSQVFKLIQYRCPWSGGFHQIYLGENGAAQSERVTFYAREAGRETVLNRSEIDVIKRRLADLATKTQSAGRPEAGELCFTLVISGQTGDSRLDFAGEIPKELQEVLDVLNRDFEKTEKVRYEAFLEEERRLKEEYGDWLDMPGIIRVGTGGEIPLKNEHSRLLYLRGRRQPVAHKADEIPIYYALVSFPEEGRVIGGASLEGSRSDNPISGSGLTWTTSKTGYEKNEELLIRYDAINYRISIKTSEFDPSKGNLFIVRMGHNWRPEITQLNIVLDPKADKQTIVDLFNNNLTEQKIELR